jgi:hypothetical protein
MFPESFTYHRGYAGVNLAAASNVARYFSIRPADTDAMRAIKAKCAERTAFMRRAAEAHFPVCYPNGLIPPFGDSSAAHDAPRKVTQSALLPAYGHVALGDGSSDLQTQLNMGWGDLNNHCQDDVLGITLFAFGAEVIANNRYDRGPSRPFNNHALSHNTVLIDRESQPRRGANGLYTSGNLTLYEPCLDGIAVVEVDGHRACLGKASRYQRMVILNTADLAHPYAVDFFAVAGGKMHDYLLHGATTFEEKATLSFAAAPMGDAHPLLAGGEKWQDPAKGSFPIYGMIMNVSQGRSPGAWDATYLGIKEPVGSRLFMLDDGTHQVFLAQSPVLGSVGGEKDQGSATTRGRAKPAGGEEAPAQGEDPLAPSAKDQAVAEPAGSFARHLRPSLLVRREAKGGEPLRSLFVGVIEPVKGASAIAGIERLPLQADDPDTVALRIRFLDGREDVVLVNLDHPAIAGCPGKEHAIVTRDGSYGLQGRVGIHVLPKAGGERAVMIGASRFQYGKNALAQERAALAGQLVGAERRKDGAKADVLITDADLPAGDILKGRWMSVAFGAYRTDDGREQKGISEQFQIAYVEKVGGRTLIHMTEDHALSIRGDTLTEIMRPLRVFKGPSTFEIPLSKCSAPQAR